jgi:hypothetical protein
MFFSGIVERISLVVKISHRKKNISMEYTPYDIRLDDITFSVAISACNEIYRAQYRKIVTFYLWMQGRYYFEKDLFERFPNQPLTTILEENSNIVADGFEEDSRDDNNLLPTYYDLAMPISIEPSDSFFPKFFAFKLQYTDILNIDSFLEYQWQKNFNGDLAQFSRFLQLLIRKHMDKIIPAATALTILEWTDLKEKQLHQTSSSITNSIGIRKKGVIRRMQNDSVTCLSQEQTVLLFSMLQQIGIFMKDEYLTDADAGKAFEILTGYSQNTIRQKLARYTEFATLQNLLALKQTIAQVTNIINETLKGAHPDSQRKLAS